MFSYIQYEGMHPPEMNRSNGHEALPSGTECAKACAGGEAGTEIYRRASGVSKIVQARRATFTLEDNAEGTRFGG